MNRHSHCRVLKIEKGVENLLEEKVTENFPNVGKEIDVQVYSGLLEYSECFLLAELSWNLALKGAQVIWVVGVSLLGHRLRVGKCGEEQTGKIRMRSYYA